MKRPEINKNNLVDFWVEKPEIFIRSFALFVLIISTILAPIMILFEEKKLDFKGYFNNLYGKVLKYVWAKYYT